jgi:hypothetical protein
MDEAVLDAAGGSGVVWVRCEVTYPLNQTEELHANAGGIPERDFGRCIVRLFDSCIGRRGRSADDGNNRNDHRVHLRNESERAVRGGYRAGAVKLAHE